MDNSGHVEEQLSAYLDGELVEQETMKVKQHLHACSECHAQLEEIALLRQHIAAVYAAPELELPDTFASSVMNQLLRSPGLLNLPNRYTLWAGLAVFWLFVAMALAIPVFLAASFPMFGWMLHAGIKLTASLLHIVVSIIQMLPFFTEVLIGVAILLIIVSTFSLMRILSFVRKLKGETA